MVFLGRVSLVPVDGSFTRSGASRHDDDDAWHDLRHLALPQSVLSARLGPPTTDYGNNTSALISTHHSH